MERTKIALDDLPDLEKEILNLCIYMESFSKICEECSWTKDENVIADAIKTLIHQKLLKTVNQGNSLSWIYDSDRMRESQFILTAQGIELISS